MLNDPFGFEVHLVNETVARWVAANRADVECRKVLTTHEKARRLKTPETIQAYEMALKELWVIRPWDCGNIGLDLFPRKNSVLVG